MYHRTHIRTFMRNVCIRLAGLDFQPAKHNVICHFDPRMSCFRRVAGSSQSETGSCTNHGICVHECDLVRLPASLQHGLFTLSAGAPCSCNAHRFIPMIHRRAWYAGGCSCLSPSRGSSCLMTDRILPRTVSSFFATGTGLPPTEGGWSPHKGCQGPGQCSQG
jgi:hypothetical protein